MGENKMKINLLVKINIKLLKKEYNNKVIEIELMTETVRHYTKFSSAKNDLAK
jgi:hypothetical protein